MAAHRRGDHGFTGYRLRVGKVRVQPTSAGSPRATGSSRALLGERLDAACRRGAQRGGESAVGPVERQLDLDRRDAAVAVAHRRLMASLAIAASSTIVICVSLRRFYFRSRLLASLSQIFPWASFVASRRRIVGWAVHIFLTSSMIPEAFVD